RRSRRRREAHEAGFGGAGADERKAGGGRGRAGEAALDAIGDAAAGQVRVDADGTADADRPESDDDAVDVDRPDVAGFEPEDFAQRALAVDAGRHRLRAQADVGEGAEVEADPLVRALEN